MAMNTITPETATTRRNLASLTDIQTIAGLHTIIQTNPYIITTQVGHMTVQTINRIHRNHGLNTKKGPDNTIQLQLTPRGLQYQTGRG
jgi:hypothetical protein